MDMLGALGGYVKTKSNPYPGFEVLWRGLMRLNDVEWGIKIAIEHFFGKGIDLGRLMG